MTRRPSSRAWLAIATVAWVALLIAAGVYAVRYRPPTIIEQTTIVKALPTVDLAIGAVVTAAMAPQAVVSIGGYERTRARCAAGNRTGERYQRNALVHVAPGQEPGVIDRVAAALPRSYRPQVRHIGPVHGLRADAGYYVTLTGGLVRPGELRFTADTGCRLRGGRIPADDAGDQAPAPARTAADAALAALGVPASGTSAYRVGCPSGGDLTTVAVTAPPPVRAVPDALPAGATALISSEDLLVFPAGEVGVTVARAGDGVVVTATGGCQ